MIEFIDIVSGGTSTHPYDLCYTNGADNTGGTPWSDVDLAPGDYAYLLYDDWRRMGLERCGRNRRLGHFLRRFRILGFLRWQ